MVKKTPKSKPVLLTFISLAVIVALAVLVYAFVTDQVTAPVAGGNYTTTLTVNCSADMINVANVTVYANASGGAAEYSTVLGSIANTSGNASWAEYYNTTVDISSLTVNSTYNVSCVFYNDTGVVGGNVSVSINSVTLDSVAPYVERVNVEYDNATIGGIYVGSIVVNATANDTAFGAKIPRAGGVWFNLTTNGIQRGFISASNMSDYNYNATIPAGTYPDGNYTIVVYANDSVNNLNKTENFTIILDSNGPNVTLNNISDYGNYSGTIKFNVTVADYVGVSSVFVNISNSSGGDGNHTLLNTTNFKHASNLTGEAGRLNRTFNHYNFTLITNTSAYPDGYYNFTVYTNDTTVAANLNNTNIYRIMIDNTAPSVTLTRNSNSTATTLTADVSISDGAGSGASPCSVTRTGGSPVMNGVSGATQTMYEEGLSCNTQYTYTVTCVDFAGNTASSSATSFSTEQCQGGGGGGSGSGGSGAATGKTYVLTDEQFEDGYTKELESNDKMEVTVASSSGASIKHSVKVSSVDANTVTIVVSSEPQSATLQVGDTRKFDVNGDDYYDIEVTLNSITAGKADITVMQISEEVTGASQAAEDEKQAAADEAAQDEPEEGASKTWVWIIVIVIILILIGAGYGIKKRK